jgi:hypothetical protein
MKNKLKNIALVVMCSVLISTLSSCLLFTGVRSEAAEVTDTHEKDGFTRATIIKFPLDGCSYMLRLKNGNDLEPVNLSEEFKKDSCRVWIKYQSYKGSSVCMAGPMVTITAIEADTSVQKKSNK